MEFDLTEVWFDHKVSPFCVLIWEMTKQRPPEPLDFFIWTIEDVGLWLEEIKLGSYREIFKENGVNGEYLEGMSMFTTEQILRFIRRCHMKWGDFITLCKELRRIKVACLKGEQKVRQPWWAPSCLSVIFVKAAKRNRQGRVVSLKLEPWWKLLVIHNNSHTVGFRHYFFRGKHKKQGITCLHCRPKSGKGISCWFSSGELAFTC